MKFDELEQSSLRERLSKLLRRAIFSGALRPGERIVETEGGRKRALQAKLATDAILE
jgi:DNA-binding GntR family transcriptional regulator